MMKSAATDSISGLPVVTDRLILRRLTEADAENILTIYGDEETVKYKPMYALKDLTSANAYLSELMKDYEDELNYLYGICLKDDPERKVIGCIRVGVHEPYEMGYTIRRDLWNHGIASEAAKAVLHRIRRDQVLPYVIATHDENNPASGKVMEHAGMTYQKAYREQWMPKNIPVVFRLYRIDF